MKPQLPRVSPWIIAILLFLFIFWATGKVYCQDLSQAHSSPNRIVYYDTMINCTAIKIKRFPWGSKTLVHTHYFWVRYTKLPNGMISTKHVRFYYPNRSTRIRMIWYTDIPQYTTDSSSNRYEVIGELKMQ